MKQVFFSFLTVVFCNLAVAQSLEKLWASDSVLKVPESVYFDEKNEKIYVSNIEGKGPW
ncbi:MAG: hypothetical protein RLY46_1917, partial [Bacteroidota bacterium]